MTGGNPFLTNSSAGFSAGLFVGAKTLPGHSVAGAVEYHHNGLVTGWAIDGKEPGRPAIIDVLDGTEKIAEIVPALYRADLDRPGQATGHHGFVFMLPATLMDGGRHQVHFRIASCDFELHNSPLIVEFRYEENFVPYSPTALCGNRVLVLAPHPDDESLGCGGSICLHRNNGDDVKVLVLTDGLLADLEGHPGQSYKLLMQQETVQACSILGVSDIEFWDTPDRQLGTADQGIVSRLATLLEEYRPTLIYSPSPLEFHPDHRATAALVWQAIQQTQLELSVAFYEFNRPIQVNTLADITGVIDTKKAAIAAYSSQLRNFPYDECAVGLNRYRSLTLGPGCTFAEGFFLLSAREIRAHSIEWFNVKQHLPFKRNASLPCPQVSVVIPTRNRRFLLGQALESLALQSYPNIEVVVVNDCGEDVSDLTEQFGRCMTVRLINHEIQLGRTHAYNTGVQASNGEFINLLDDDDIFYEHHVERLASFLTLTGAQFVYSDIQHCRYVYQEGELQPLHVRGQFAGGEYYPERLACENHIPTMAAMFARALWERVGGLDTSVDVGEDWDLWLRMSRETHLHYLPGYTAEYRFFKDSFAEYKNKEEQVYERHASPDSSREREQRLWQRYLRLEHEHRRLKIDFAAARAQGERAVVADPADTPRVSVIVPIYNGARYLRRTLQSISEQAFAPAELILVDDGSWDGSLESVADMKFSFPVRTLKRENGGQSAARNAAAREAIGDFVAFVDHDDILYPWHLEELVRPFADSPMLGWTYGAMDQIDEDDKIVRRNLPEIWYASGFTSREKTDLAALLSSDIGIIPSASMFRKSLFLSEGGFDERLCGYEDDDLFVRMFRSGYEARNIGKVVCSWRIHPGSSGFSPRMNTSRRIYLEKLLRMFPDRPGLYQWWVRDCIAPRFFRIAHDRYVRHMEEKSWSDCLDALEDMRLCAKQMILDYRTTWRMKLMAFPRMHAAFFRFARRLPYRARVLLLG